MKLPANIFPHFISFYHVKKSWVAWLVLLIGILVTVAVVSHTQKNKIARVNKEFLSQCRVIEKRIDVRFRAHAQLLRSSAALFAASDSVSREQWKIFNAAEKINKNLVGIQGVGYSIIIPKKKLSQHIQSLRAKGFPQYDVYPAGERDMYTSIIYLEPFSGRNMRAFGYDMFSEPVRRKAMEQSRDFNNCILSGKVLLVQETDNDIQTGTLMYLPVYEKGIDPLTVKERRSAIKGWVYSPYRMDDLMSGILGSEALANKNRFHLEIYDGVTITDEALLYNSHKNNKEISEVKSNLHVILPFEFNGVKWTLKFTSNNENLSILKGNTFLLLIMGIIISLLLSILIFVLFNTRFRAKQIQVLNVELKKLDLDKDRFIAILGHDLKNPFLNLIGLSEILLEDIRAGEMGEIESIATQIHTMSQHTNDLLDEILLWARMQKNGNNFNPQKANFQNICAEVLKTLTPIAHEKNISIAYSNLVETTIFADINMLQTILRNLISNAIKFTNRKGHIVIRTEEIHQQVLVTVSDNGIGMGPELLSKLFHISEVFSSRGTANEKGTGLGLVLCREFIEKHGGKIWVESEVGKGSDFKFTMPVSLDV